MTAFRARSDITDHLDLDERIEPNEANDPIASIEANEPTLPKESTDPMLPTERTDPLDAIDKSESCDHNDHRELLDATGMDNSMAAAEEPSGNAGVRAAVAVVRLVSHAER